MMFSLGSDVRAHISICQAGCLKALNLFESFVRKGGIVHASVSSKGDVFFSAHGRSPKCERCVTAGAPSLPMQKIDLAVYWKIVVV